MNILKSLLIGLSLTIAYGNMFGQDAHFSQFYAAPLQINPAFAGVFQGSMRGTVNYRSQWASLLETNPYRSISAAYESKFQVSRDDYVGVGLQVMDEQSGPSQFSQFRANIGGSYQKRITGNGRSQRYRRSRNDQYIVAGFQLGFGQFSVNTDNLWFSSQYDAQRVNVDYTKASGEKAYNGASNFFAGLNTGLLWYALLGDNKSVYVGGALNNANAPAIRFDPNSEGYLLKWRWVGQIGAELPFSDVVSILPAYIIQRQGVSQQMMTGFNLRYNAQDWREVALRAGLWTRFANKAKGQQADAIIVTSVLEMEKLNIGMSYDINISKLRPASNYRGALEISIAYVHQERKRKNKVICPRF